jgi:hypothetical protein
MNCINHDIGIMSILWNDSPRLHSMGIKIIVKEFNDGDISVTIICRYTNIDMAKKPKCSPSECYDWIVNYLNNHQN